MIDTLTGGQTPTAGLGQDFAAGRIMAMNSPCSDESGGPADIASAGPPRAHLIIAVKDLESAKSRLAESFDADDRVRLVLAMLTDTVRAAHAAAPIGDITVITPDSEVRELANALGVSTIDDIFARRTDIDTVDKLNAALGFAAAHIRSVDPRSSVVALQADLPAMRSGELVQAYQSAGVGRSVVLDHHGTGTVALIVKESDALLSPMFGPASARRHTESGAIPLGGEWPGLRLDVDTVTDLGAAVELGVGDATRVLLDEIRHRGSAVRR